jgi:hypothetical protein
MPSQTFGRSFHRKLESAGSAGCLLPVESPQILDYSSCFGASGASQRLRGQESRKSVTVLERKQGFDAAELKIIPLTVNRSGESLLILANGQRYQAPLTDREYETLGFYLGKSEDGRDTWLLVDCCSNGFRTSETSECQTHSI